MLHIKIAGEIAIMHRFHELVELLMRFALKVVEFNYLVKDHGYDEDKVNEPTFRQ
jgi:hypothetical protein